MTVFSLDSSPRRNILNNRWNHPHILSSSSLQHAGSKKPCWDGTERVGVVGWQLSRGSGGFLHTAILDGQNPQVVQSPTHFAGKPFCPFLVFLYRKCGLCYVSSRFLHFHGIFNIMKQSFPNCWYWYYEVVCDTEKLHFSMFYGGYGR